MTELYQGSDDVSVIEDTLEAKVSRLLVAGKRAALILRSTMR